MSKAQKNRTANTIVAISTTPNVNESNEKQVVTPVARPQVVGYKVLINRVMANNPAMVEAAREIVAVEYGLPGIIDASEFGSAESMSEPVAEATKQMAAALEKKGSGTTTLRRFNGFPRAVVGERQGRSNMLGSLGSVDVVDEDVLSFSVVSSSASNS